MSESTVSPHPFLDYRLDVTFTHNDSRTTLKVPGFFAADGQAADSGASSGSVWQVRFVPSLPGCWTFNVSFLTGQSVAVIGAAGQLVGGVHGASGGILVQPATSTSVPLRLNKGMLRYVGKRYLQYEGTQEYFLKSGANSPENFLAYADFDNTVPTHSYSFHAGDFTAASACSNMTWRGGKGKNILGALTYLSSVGVNAVYFLTMNINGDGKDVWPYVSSSDYSRFDVSKLEQWERVFTCMDVLGIMLHVQTQEIENEKLLDNGDLGTMRKLYYRELIARFGHHRGVTWDLGEETSRTDLQRKDYATFIRHMDPYDHPVVMFSQLSGPSKENLYRPMIGFTRVEGTALQLDITKEDISAEVSKWVEASEAGGRPWIVTFDEIGPSSWGVMLDSRDPTHDVPRANVLWSVLMSGGAGVEWYFGYADKHSDLTCEDFRSRDSMWKLTEYAVAFFRLYVPFTELKPLSTAIVSTGSSKGIARCFGKFGLAYVFYFSMASSITIDLQGDAQLYYIAWYDPRNGL